MDSFCISSRRVCRFAGLQICRNIAMVRIVTRDRLGQKTTCFSPLVMLVMVLGCMILDVQGGLHRVLWWDCEVAAGSDLELYCGVPWPAVL